uniref:Uncharacterized protein n=1 Tax=Anguilla anguilla TaxID=7936 RepID=A0A0E9WNV1_ANGAN
MCYLVLSEVCNDGAYSRYWTASTSVHQHAHRQEQHTGLLKMHHVIIERLDQYKIICKFQLQILQFPYRFMDCYTLKHFQFSCTDYNILCFNIMNMIGPHADSLWAAG